MTHDKQPSQIVTLSVAMWNGHRYQFTVEVPRDFVDHKDALKWTGCNATGEKVKLRHLGPAVMELLTALRLANSFECDPGEGGTWKLRRDRQVGRAWLKLRRPNPTEAA